MTDLRTDIAEIEADYNIKIGSQAARTGNASYITEALNREKDAAVAGLRQNWQDLYYNIDTYVKAENSTSKSKNTTDYSKGYEAYKTEADKKLALLHGA